MTLFLNDKPINLIRCFWWILGIETFWDKNNFTFRYVLDTQCIRAALVFQANKNIYTVKISTCIISSINKELGKKFYFAILGDRCK